MSCRAQLACPDSAHSRDKVMGTSDFTTTGCGSGKRMYILPLFGFKKGGKISATKYLTMRRSQSFIGLFSLSLCMSEVYRVKLKPNS